VADGWPAGTWSSNGSILVEVTENPEEEGWYLLAPGGTTLTKVKAFARDRPINPDKAFPWFLPDGEHFLFTHPVGTVPTVQVGSIRSDVTRALVSADTRAVFADGHILYVRQGTLFAHPFDPSSLTLTGDARAIVEDVDFFSPTGEMGVTASETGTLVYRPQAGRSQLRWFDRAGRDLGAVLEPDYYDAVAIARDGRRLALGIRNPRQSTSDLWTVDLDRTVPIRLTSSPRTEMAPVWSPDGNRIVFSTDWEGPPNLYIGDASGGEPKVLVPFDRTQQYAGGWTPDGGQVLYARRSETSGTDIWVVDVASGERQPVLATAFDEHTPTLAPNGRWLAYTSNASGRPEIYVREYPSGRWQDRVSIDGGFGPAWRADSGELFFYELSGALASVPTDGSAEGRPRMGRPTRLFTVDGERFQSYVPTPDGQRFLLNLAEPGALTPPDVVIVDWRRLIRP
jgi:hypothetical protein